MNFSYPLTFTIHMYRDENVFDALLEDINEHNLALKTTINDVDLLIFSSLELPREHWSKYKLLSLPLFTFYLSWHCCVCHWELLEHLNCCVNSICKVSFTHVWWISNNKHTCLMISLQHTYIGFNDLFLVSFFFRVKFRVHDGYCLILTD